MSPMQPSSVLSLDQIDLSDLAFWERPWAEREGAFEPSGANDHWPSSRSPTSPRPRPWPHRRGPATGR